MAMFEITQISNEQDQDLKEKGFFFSSIYQSKNKDSLPHKQFEPIADYSSQNTIQNPQNSIFDKLFVNKNNFIEKNDLNSLNKQHLHKKKKVKFKDPFLDFVNVESLKEFNLKMTYIEYIDEEEVNSFHKECCNKFKHCDLI